ncbi:MAG TPA: peptide ABC transporter substrate-binding protein [Virgibacillus sp.]|nr:peptide ABC transporter substrate-binding protein [Virgibacillus sp.]
MKGLLTNKKLIILTVLLFSFALFMSACSSDEEPNGSPDDGTTNNNNNDDNGNNDNDGDSDGEAADDQVLRFTESDEIRSMDISFATDVISHNVMNRVFSGLLIYEDDELVPEIAEDMPEVNDDNTEYTFTLRDDAEWSNGDPVTADDFVYSWRRALDKDFESQYDYIFEAANIANASEIVDEDSDMFGETEELGVEAVDEHTLKVTLDKATPEQYFNSLMQFAPFFPLNEEFVEEQGDDFAEEPENLLYNGAFVLDEWNHGEGWTLKKNEDYFNADEVNIEEVDFQVVKDTKTALKLYENGEIDRVQLRAEDVEKYQDDPEFQELPDVGVFYWDFDRNNVPEFENENLRKAIFLSLDRDSAADVILNDGSMGANYVVPQEFATGPDGNDFHDEGGKANPEDYPNSDKEEAQEYWEKAKEELDIDELEIEYMTTDTSTSEELADYFANEIEENLDGITIDINKQPFKSYLDLTSSGEAELAAGSGWQPDYEDPMTFLELFTSDNPQNTYGLEDDEYDSMIEKADDLGDKPEERWEVLQEAEQYLIDNALIVPTYQSGIAVLTKDYIDGNIDQVNGIKNFFRYAEIKDH